MKAYNIYYYDYDEYGETDRVDATQVDELNEELIWDLYEEFGFIRNEHTYYTYEEVEIDEEIPF